MVCGARHAHWGYEIIARIGAGGPPRSRWAEPSIGWRIWWYSEISFSGWRPPPLSWCCAAAVRMRIVRIACPFIRLSR